VSGIAADRDRPEVVEAPLWDPGEQATVPYACRHLDVFSYDV
jgi:hypothetical protein